MEVTLQYELLHAKVNNYSDSKVDVSISTTSINSALRHETILKTQSQARKSCQGPWSTDCLSRRPVRRVRELYNQGISMLEAPLQGIWVSSGHDPRLCRFPCFLISYSLKSRFFTIPVSQIKPMHHARHMLLSLMCMYSRGNFKHVDRVIHG